MTAKSVLMRPQGLRPGARAPTCTPLATPMASVLKWYNRHRAYSIWFKRRRYKDCRIFTWIS